MYRFLVRLALRLHSFSYKLVSKFAIMAEGGLHPKHRLMGYHDFFVNRIKQSDVVLDIGCGNGALAFDLAKKAKQVVGIDLNEKNKVAWEKQYAASNLEYCVADATTVKPEQTFDIVVLSNVLEHIEYRNEFLKKIRGLASTFLIRVPVVDRDWITLYKKELGLEYRLDTTHHIEYTLESFMDELKAAGFKVQSCTIQFGEIWAHVEPL